MELDVGDCVGQAVSSSAPLGPGWQGAGRETIQGDGAESGCELGSYQAFGGEQQAGFRSSPEFIDIKNRAGGGYGVGRANQGPLISTPGVPALSLFLLLSVTPGIHRI